MTAPTKYSGLPDIDDAADIYETQDPPYSISTQNDSDSEDSLKRIRRTGKGEKAEDAEGREVDARRLIPGRRRVRQVFGRRERGVGGLDERTTEHGEGSESSSETDPSEPNITARASALRLRETPHARLRRLKYEMAQLERELQTPEGEVPKPQGRRPAGPSNGELLTQLAELQDRAEGCERGVALPVGRAGELVREVVRGVQPRSDVRHGQAAEEPVMGADAGYVADLDKRLHALERRIGTGTVDETTLPDSILTTLRKTTDLQSLLINPRTLDAASRKIKLLLADLNRASLAATKQPTPAATHPDESEKIATLYALLPRLDPLLPLLSPLLTRLRALAPLHANASAAQETLSAIERDAVRAERREEEVRAVLERVERRLGENAGMVEGNWATLEARLGDLQARLERLA